MTAPNAQHEQAPRRDTATAAPTPRPELLAPAGDWEALRAAVANGADAVYFGLHDFSARHRAVNFGLQELAQVMEYLHAHNVRGYLTLNTLVFSDELEDAASVVAGAAAAGVDAIIVQDLGIASLIARMAPTLQVHASTQMTLTEPRGIDFVRGLGVGRVILARELSMGEIGRIVAASPLPVEVFVHGAMCISYSGQCLTSEALGGRSANRGQCAQACRLPYDLIVDGQRRDLGERAYLLSPQDLAAHDLIGPLAKLGVRAFKIEGRLKSAHYVAAATQAYRAALDAAIDGRSWRIDPRQRQDLEQSFSRGFSHGFLNGPDHQTLVHARFPKSRGVRIGTVCQRANDGLLIELEPSVGPLPPIENRKSRIESPLKPGDGVVFDEGHPEQDEQGGRIASVEQAGRMLKVRFHRGDVNLAAVGIGAIVWKTDDPAMRRRLEQSFARERVARTAPLHLHIRAAVGRPLRIEACDDDGHRACVESNAPLEPAQRHPLDEALVRQQLGRLGNTPFALDQVQLSGADDDAPPEAVMAPKSVLNDLRRRLVAMLLEQRRSASRHAIVEPDALPRLRREIEQWGAAQSAPNDDSPRLCVLVRTMEQLQAVAQWRPLTGPRPAMVYCDFEDVRRYGEAVAEARAAAMPVGLATVRIVKPSEEGLLRRIADCRPDAVLIRNLASLSFFRESAPGLAIIGDYSLNVANELTALILARAGLMRLTCGYDLNWPQVAALAGRFPARFFEVVIHQHMPMFHMEHCVFAHTLSEGKDHRTCGRPCDRHRLDLRDRVGQSHPLVADVGCRNTLFNAAAQSAAEYVPRMKALGLRHFRVELLRESADEAIALLERYVRVLGGLDDGRSTWRRVRALSQLGVTRGTLEHA